MDANNSLKERRRQGRYQAKEQTYVLVESNSDGELGELIDINRFGLSYRRYVGNGRAKLSFELSIMAPTHLFSLHNLPFEVVSESGFVEAAGSKAQKIIKRRGVRFGNLEPDQVKRLAFFIDTQTR